MDEVEKHVVFCDHTLPIKLNEIFYKTDIRSTILFPSFVLNIGLLRSFMFIK